MADIAVKETFSTQLTNAIAEVKDAIPVGFNTTRFVLNSVALLNENETLQKFVATYPTGKSQVKQGMLKAAYLGLDFMQKEAYLIPYGNQLQFMIDYRGNVKLCKKYATRPIKDIYAKLVREGDFFEESIVDGHPSIAFKPITFSNKPIVGAFAVVLYEDGGMDYEVMSLDELNKARSKSKAGSSMAWKDFQGEMYRKVVLHRLCKHIDISFDNPNQYDLFTEDMAIETDPKNIADREIEENANTEEFVISEVLDE